MADTLKSLREQNAALKAEIVRLNAELAEAKATPVQPTKPAKAAFVPTEPMQAISIDASTFIFLEAHKRFGMKGPQVLSKLGIKNLKELPAGVTAEQVLARIQATP